MGAGSPQTSSGSSSASTTQTPGSASGNRSTSSSSSGERTVVWGSGGVRGGPGGRKLGRRRPRRACTTPDNSDGSRGMEGSGPGASETLVGAGDALVGGRGALTGSGGACSPSCPPTAPPSRAGPVLPSGDSRGAEEGVTCDLVSGLRAGGLARGSRPQRRSRRTNLRTERPRWRRRAPDAPPGVMSCRKICSRERRLPSTEFCKERRQMPGSVAGRATSLKKDGTVVGPRRLGSRRDEGWEVTYIVRVLCREVLYRWDGALGNKLPVGGWRLLLHDLSLHPGQGGKDAGRNEGCSVTGGASQSSLSEPGRVSSLRTQARIAELGRPWLSQKAPKVPLLP